MKSLKLKKSERTTIKITNCINSLDTEIIYEYDVYNGNIVCGRGTVRFLACPEGIKAHDEFFKRYCK